MIVPAANETPAQPLPTPSGPAERAEEVRARMEALLRRLPPPPPERRVS